MDPGKLLLFTVAGLSEAAFLFIVAAGLSLVFGALRVINMAHGSLYMVAAFVTAFVAAKVGLFAGFWTGLLAAVIVTGLVGIVIEVVVLRRVYQSEHLYQLLGTYALTLIIAGAVRIIFGASFRTISPPAFLNGSVTMLSGSYSTYDFFMIGAALVIGAGLWVMLYRTPLGRNIRAAVSDPVLLNATGVNVSRLYTIVFMIGAILAGLGGVLVAPSQVVSLDMDNNVLVLAFAISVIGGLGSIVGSLVGALVVGMIESFGVSNRYTAHLSIAFIFIVMVVVLTIRPSGLFGKPEQ
jgi:branched-subunit amino acid ABC-type transport system permease component